MPIIMDLSNIMVSTLMAQLGRHTNAQVDESMLRHMVLNTIRSNKKKFTEYGELIIAADDKNYWRKSAFPYYKAMRKVNRESSELDWNAIFSALNKIKQEIKDNFPYKVVQVPHAEADDIIAVVCEERGQLLASGERILILSADKDMTQLQSFANVDQWDPIRKRWLKNTTPEKTLFEHIVKGDTGDGIPNVRSNDDAIVTKTRQQPVRQKMIDEWYGDINTMPTEVRRNFERNKLLIDFGCIPEEIKAQIREQLNEKNKIGREKLFNYFIEHQLRNLLTDIGDF